MIKISPLLGGNPLMSAVRRALIPCCLERGLLEAAGGGGGHMEMAGSHFLESKVNIASNLEVSRSLGCSNVQLALMSANLSSDSASTDFVYIGFKFAFQVFSLNGTEMYSDEFLFLLSRSLS